MDTDTEVRIFGLDPSSPLALLIAAGAAIILGLVAQAVAWWILKKTTGRFSFAHLLLEKTANAARLFAPLLLLQFVWSAAPATSTIGFLMHCTSVLLIIAVVAMVVRSISAASEAIVAAQPITSADNLEARRVQTQAQVISRSVKFIVILIGLGAIIMTFPAARTLGTSLLASAGLAGIFAGVAARPVLSNLIAGLQIALSQPIRLDDVLIIEGEWGRVEEITTTYVVLKIWDERRLIIPLQWFIDNPFQNWTRIGAQLIGTVFWWVDYRMPIEPLREQLKKVCEASPLWDGRLSLIQVTDVSDRAIQLRALVTAADSGKAWDLRCEVREALIGFMQREYPSYLPQQRQSVALKSVDRKGAVVDSQELSSEEQILQEQSFPEQSIQRQASRTLNQEDQERHDRVEPNANKRRSLV